MKHTSFYLYLLCASFLLSCHNVRIIGQTPEATPLEEVKPQQPSPFVSWDKKLIQLGPVKKGEKRTMAFEFTNTFGEDIQIDIVDACDCTTVDFPRGPIGPNEKGRLDVIFNSAEKDASETISINVIFRNTHPDGVPYIETVEYAYDLVK